MKRTIAIAVILIAFSGCKKSDSSPSYQMSADISGHSAFSTTNCVCMYVSFPQDSTFEIYGSALDQNGTPIYPSISIDMYTYHGVGTYDASTFDAAYQTGQSSSGSTVRSIAITSVSSTAVSGTFSFTEQLGSSTVTVSNGHFTAKVK